MPVESTFKMEGGFFRQFNYIFSLAPSLVSLKGIGNVGGWSVVGWCVKSFISFNLFY